MLNFGYISDITVVIIIIIIIIKHSLCVLLYSIYSNLRVNFAVVLTSLNHSDVKQQHVTLLKRRRQKCTAGNILQKQTTWHWN